MYSAIIVPEVNCRGDGKMRRLRLWVCSVCATLATLVAVAADVDGSRGVNVATGAEGTSGRLVLAVIGIDDYKHWQTLDNAVSDAVGFQQALVEKAGFTVPIEPLLNADATKSSIMAFVQDRLHQKLEADDQLILFFAGHGQTRVTTVADTQRESGYLVPVDAPSAGEDELWSAYIPIEEFLRAVDELPARHILVVLDACHSGFALGSAVEKMRGTEDYRNVLSQQISRRAITSARKDQLASDRGPLPNHSLFTGSFVDGLTWGKIDTDANGLVTSSEIGLYLRQSVGQASDSQQTPDFGAFGIDARGELTISLNNQSFSALTARAMNALNHGRHTELAELNEQLAATRPDDPKTLYFRYRLALLSGDLDTATRAVSTLASRNFDPGDIPLTTEDLWDLNAQLPYWRPVLELSERGSAEIQVDVVLKSGQAVDAVPMGDIQAFPVPVDGEFRLRIENKTNQPRFVSLMLISETGRIRPVRLWEQIQRHFNGMLEGETLLSVPLQKYSLTGIEELRFIVAHAPIEELLFPLDSKSRGVKVIPQESIERIAKSHQHAVRLATARDVE